MALHRQFLCATARLVDSGLALLQYLGAVFSSRGVTDSSCPSSCVALQETPASPRSATETPGAVQAPQAVGVEAHPAPWLLLPCR